MVGEKVREREDCILLRKKREKVEMEMKRKIERDLRRLYKKEKRRDEPRGIRWELGGK